MGIGELIARLAGRRRRTSGASAGPADIGGSELAGAPGAGGGVPMAMPGAGGPVAGRAPVSLYRAARLLCVSVGGTEVTAAIGLADRLEEDGIPVDLEIACPNPGTVARSDMTGATWSITALPPDNRAATEAWLEAFPSDAILWLGPLEPSPLLEAVAGAGRSLFAADVPAPRLLSGRVRRTRRAQLSAFSHIFTRDRATAGAFRHLGLTETRVEGVGPFHPVPEVPPCDPTDRDDMARELKARPVWLAASPALEEMGVILEAHRSALRVAHRLLLIVVPADEADGPALARDLAADGWRTARRSAGEEPIEAVEIFVADTHEEVGLWVRLAPVTYLGGTFAGKRVADPAAAATLGSAIVAGTRWDGKIPLLDRLAAASAVELVRSPAGLGTAVADLLTPDAAAARAHAAWEIVSDGARVQDRIVAALRPALKAALAADATRVADPIGAAQPFALPDQIADRQQSASGSILAPKDQAARHGDGSSGTSTR